MNQVHHNPLVMILVYTVNLIFQDQITIEINKISRTQFCFLLMDNIELTE